MVELAANALLRASFTQAVVKVRHLVVAAGEAHVHFFVEVWVSLQDLDKLVIL